MEHVLQQARRHMWQVDAPRNLELTTLLAPLKRCPRRLAASQHADHLNPSSVLSA